MGMTFSVAFIAVQATADKAHTASAISTLYLFSTVGTIIGLACMSATLQATLRMSLASRLAGLAMDSTRAAEVSNEDRRGFDLPLTGVLTSSCIDHFEGELQRRLYLPN